MSSILRIAGLTALLLALPTQAAAEPAADTSAEFADPPLKVFLGGAYAQSKKEDQRGLQRSSMGKAARILSARIPDSTVDFAWWIEGDESFMYTDFLNVGQRDQCGTYFKAWTGLHRDQTIPFFNQRWFDSLRRLDGYDVLVLKGFPAWRHSKDPEENRARTKELYDGIYSFMENGGTLVFFGNWNDSLWNYGAPSGANKLEEAELEDPPLIAVFKNDSAKSHGGKESAPHKSPAFYGIPLDLIFGLNPRSPAGLTPPLPRNAKALYSNKAYGSDKESILVAEVPVGKGRCLLFPEDFVAEGYLTMSMLPPFLSDKIDCEEIYLRMWEQLFSWYKSGAAAYPAMVDLQTPAAEVPAGSDFTLDAMILNSACSPNLLIEINVRAPGTAGVDELRASKEIKAEKGMETKISLPIKAEAPWQSGYHQIEAVLRDAAGKKILHRAMGAVKIGNPMSVRIECDKAGYPPGGKVAVKCTAGNRQASDFAGDLKVIVHDFRMRILMRAGKPVNISAGASGSYDFEFEIPENDVRGYAFYAIASLLKDGKEWACGRTQFYRWQRWNPRQTYLLGHGMESAGLRGALDLRIASDIGMSASCFQPDIASIEQAGFFGDYQGLLGIPNFEIPWMELGENNSKMESEMEKIVLSTQAFNPLTGKYERRNVVDCKGEPGNPSSPAIVIRSLGEEGGYKGGWGKLWSWKEDVAPELPTRLFHSYLKTIYPSLKELNESWGTAFSSWDEDPEGKTRGKTEPGATDAERLDELVSGKSEDGGSEKLAEEPSVPEKATGSVTLERKFVGEAEPLAASQARYVDTREFFNWYMNVYLGTAAKVVRKYCPVPLFTYSCGNHWKVKGEVEDFELGGSCVLPRQEIPPAETAYEVSWMSWPKPAMVRNIIWDVYAKRIAFFWGYVGAFNIAKDQSNSVSSINIKKVSERVRPKEYALLQSEPIIDPGICLYESSHSRPSPLTQWARALDAKTALMRSGFRYPVVFTSGKLQWYERKPLAEEYLKLCKAIVAPMAMRMDIETAARISDFVRQGGTLIAIDSLAFEDIHGKAYDECPGAGMDEVLGLKIKSPYKWRSNKAALNTQFIRTGPESAPIPAGLVLDTTVANKDIELSGSAKVLAKFADGAPAVTVNPFGKGKAYFLNFTSAGYSYWMTEMDPALKTLPAEYRLSAAETFRRILESLVADSGVKPLFELRNSQGAAPPEILTAISETRPVGEIKYFFAYANHSEKELSVYPQHVEPGNDNPDYTLKWNDDAGIAYDALEGKRYAGGKDSSAVKLTLREGDGTVLAFMPYEVKNLEVHISPEKITCGDLLKIFVEAETSNASPGTHFAKLRIRNTATGEEIQGLEKNFTLEAGKGEAILQTALNDPPGEWIVEVEDLSSGVKGTGKLMAAAPADIASLPKPAPFNWPSAEPPQRKISEAKFIEELESLTKLHLADDRKDRFNFSFYMMDDGHSRHSLSVDLNSVDWRGFREALSAHLAKGANILLMGEDLGYDPGSRISVYPYAKAHQFDVLQQMIGEKEGGAAVYTSQKHPDILLVSIGKGSLAIDRSSPDSQVWRINDYDKWHKEWLSRLKNAGIADGTWKQKGLFSEVKKDGFDISEWFFSGYRHADVK